MNRDDFPGGGVSDDNHARLFAQYANQPGNDPVALAAMNLPVSVGGLGPREAAAVAAWPALGLDSADGAAAALLYGAVILAGSLPGAFLLARSPRSRARRGRAA